MFVRKSAASWIRFTPALALVVSGLSGAAIAQSPGVLGKNDAQFARRLYEAGYTDLAEKLCGVIQKAGNAAPGEIVGVKALQLDLQLDLARRESDLSKRMESIKSILQEKTELIEQYGGSKEAEEAANTLPDVYADLGRTITQLVQKEQDAGRIAQLQNEGSQIYAKAEEQLQERVKRLEKDRSDPKAEQQYMVSLYNLPRTYYFHSVLYPKGEWKKGELLEKAIEGFDVFGLDYSDQALAYEGKIYRGLCDKELEKYEDAITSFDEAIAVRENFEKDQKTGVWQMPEIASDIVSDGALQKILLQTEQKDYAGAVATAKDYLETTPAPFEARRGLAVLAAQAEAYLAASDLKGAAEAARQLVEADDRGSWGAKGREIQGKLIGSGGGAIDPADTLKIASTLAGRGNSEAALQICRQAITNSRGTEKEAAVATDAYLLMGSIFLDRQWKHEAALAFDTAAERYPNAEKAPEAVYYALTVYSQINTVEKKPFYKKRIDERMKTLATKYASHPRAASAQLVEGQDLEEDKEYVKAAELYSKVQPGTASYQEAQYKLGRVYFLQADKLLKEGKRDDAKQYVTQAETILAKLVGELEQEAGKTIDLAAQSRLVNLAFNARTALVQLYLLAGVDRPADALKALEGIDEKYSTDAEKLSSAWGFRIDALTSQKKYDEAMGLLDSLTKKNPDSKAIGPAAGKVARALDARANDLRDKEKKPKEADEMLRKSAQYYSLSGKSLLRSDLARATEIETIADRLYVLGLIFNEVPEGQGLTFVGWSTKQTRDPKLWQESADLYEAALRVSPSYKTQVNLARIYGFLGDYDKAARVLGQLFDLEPIYDSTSRRFNSALLRSKPGLLTAYLEWGIAEHEAAVKDQDQEGFTRAVSVLENLVGRGGLEPTSKLWWHAKYHQIRALFDQGKYEPASLILRDTERNSGDLGGGDPALRQAFKDLGKEIGTKMLSPQQAGAAAATSQKPAAPPTPQKPAEPPKPN